MVLFNQLKNVYNVFYMILLERDKGQIVEDGSIPHIESYEWWQNATMRTLYGFNKYVIEGQENIPDETTPTLITATHRGTGDVPAIGHAFLPQHVRFVSKGCVFKVPIFGQRMREHWNTLEIDKPDKNYLWDA
jgi:1-acyl-sn-glycerol-3-phosphate acyltransferase